MAARRRSGTQRVRVTFGKLESVRAVLAKYRVAGLAHDALDRALIDAALDTAPLALVDRDSMGPHA